MGSQFTIPLHEIEFSAIRAQGAGLVAAHEVVQVQLDAARGRVADLGRVHGTGEAPVRGRRAGLGGDGLTAEDDPIPGALPLLEHDAAHALAGHRQRAEVGRDVAAVNGPPRRVEVSDDDERVEHLAGRVQEVNGNALM